MALKLDPQCQAAVDLAKRALPEGTDLDVSVLLSSLYYRGDLKQKYPSLEKYLSEPVICRPTVPEKVALAPELRPLFQNFADLGKTVSAEELFQALLNCEAGRQALIKLGVTDLSLLGPTSGATATLSAWRSSAARLSAIQALSSYGRMLTQTEPPHGRVVERENVIRALVRTLSRFKRRNVILIGAPGTGKSAMIYEMARRMYRLDTSLPSRLRDMDIFELSPAFLRSGASMVGQYDERVKSLLQVLQTHPKIILFVDEIHSLFHSGLYERGPFTDANEAFKGALSRGEITCIGCTTPAEYRHAIEPDRALERRFGIIRLEPPSRDTTLAILKARKARMEEFYAPLAIPDEILQRTIELSDDYLVSRCQPDKSIQLLDEACAYCATAETVTAVVGEEALRQALEDIIGHGLVGADELTESNIFRRLQKNIVGQDEALREISRAFVAGLGEWSKRSGPRGVFLFGGPTGVGKTETALLLARILGGGDHENLVRVDCNTLHGSSHDGGPTLNRLLGVPPGYIGYARGQGGLLSRVRDLPESIVLFDEFEKAGPVVGRLLLQIIDHGKVEDVDGNTLDFRRAYIVFTTNAGCSYDHRQMGFRKPGAESVETPSLDLELLKRELRVLGLGEEFFGRITHFIAFKGLDRSAIGTIIEKQLKSLREVSETKGLRLSWSGDVVSHLAGEWQPRFGVRFATTILRHRIGEQLDLAEAQGELKGLKEIRLEVMKLQKRKNELALAGFAERRTEGGKLIISLA